MVGTAARDTTGGKIRPLVLLSVVVLLAAFVAACTGGGDGPAPTGSPTTSFHGPAYSLRVLGGSELDDMRPILDEAARATGVTVKLTEIGTLAGAQLVGSGTAARDYDALWFSSNRYFSLQISTLNQLGTTTPIMYSPVLLGLRGSVARQLGWDRNPVSWADIAAAAAQHRFTFGMTDPTRSNSGFSALVGIAEAIANTGAALTDQDVDAAAPQLHDFFGAQAMSSGSSGWLADNYLHADSAKSSTVDGMVNYESVLLSLNASGKLHDPLIPIYPTDGVVLADYPLTLLRSASDTAKSAYQRLVGYLRTPAVQREIMDHTQRRPALSDVPLSAAFGHHQFYDLPFPDAPDVVNNLISAYFNKLRRPPRTVYVLDTSGSMAGDRIAGLKAALADLTGADPVLANQFTQFRDREQVIMLPFNTVPGTPTIFDVPDQNPRPVLDQIGRYANGLTTGGNTAMYDALVAAYGLIGQQNTTDPERIDSIVVLTDGETNTGRDLTAFTEFYHQLPAGLAAVPVFPVLFGEANAAELRQLAELTGGLTFDARTQPLAEVFKDIRGYQ